MRPNLIHSLAATLAFIALTTFPLHAATVEELVAGLRVEIEKSVAEAKANKAGGYSNTSEFDRLISRLESAIARDSFEEANQSLDQLALTKLSVQAKEQISQLQRELPKVAEERQKAFSAQVSAAIEKAGKACLEAKKEADLDAVLLELGALKKTRSESSSGMSETRQRLNARLEGASRFVTRWQDYLVQSSRGFESTARSALRELADSNSGSQYYPILPRTEIVARLGKEYDATSEEVLRETKTLNDLPKAIAEIHRMSRENRSSGSFEFPTLVTELNNLARAHAAFQAGNYGSAFLAVAQLESTGGLRSPEAVRLRMLVLLEVLPRFLELPDNPLPKDAENPSDFLLRIAAEGATQNDWARVARALDAYRQIAFGYRQPPTWIAGEIEACQHFIAGQNLEKARRIVPAIFAYQRAVKTTGKYSPYKAATDRLAALEKEHPAAFAEAGKEPQVRELLEALESGLNSRRLPYMPAGY